MDILIGSEFFYCFFYFDFTFLLPRKGMVRRRAIERQEEKCREREREREGAVEEGKGFE